MKMKKRINWKILVFSFIFVYLAAFIGSMLTFQETKTAWYESIKPSITPPNWVFPVVWNILFFLIALSLYFSLIAVKNRNFKLKIKFVFGINLFLNVLWSLFYFSFKNPVFAFFDLIALWLTILAMIFITYKADKKASLLLFPYLLWVSFAGILNYLSAFG